MFGRIFGLLKTIIETIDPKTKNDSPATQQPGEQNGVFDTVDTPNIDEFESTTPSDTPPQNEVAEETTTAPDDEQSTNTSDDAESGESSKEEEEEQQTTETPQESTTTPEGEEQTGTSEEAKPDEPSGSNIFDGLIAGGGIIGAFADIVDDFLDDFSDNKTDAPPKNDNQDSSSSSSESKDESNKDVITPTPEEQQPSSEDTSNNTTDIPSADETLDNTTSSTQPPVEPSDPFDNTPVYDENGFDQFGYDKDGYDRQGLDVLGYNREGWKFETTEQKDENGIILSKTTIKIHKNGNKIIETAKYAQDGKIESTTVENYDTEGKIQSKISEVLDKDGKVSSKTTELFGANGNITTKTLEKFNSNGKVESTTVENYDAEGKIQSKISEVLDKDGKVSTKTTELFGASGNITTKTLEKFNPNGKVDSTTVENYDAEGKLLTSVVENFDKEGRLSVKTTTQIKNSGEKTIETVKYSTNGKAQSAIIEKYNNKGVKKSQEDKEYNANGLLNKSTTIKYDEKGAPQSKHVYSASTGATKTTYYDKNGKEINKKAIDSVSGSITKDFGVADVTMSKSEIYKAITQLDATALTRKKLFFKISLTGKEIIQTVGGDRSLECLRIADKDTTATNNGKNLTLKWGKNSQTIKDANVYKANDSNLSKYSNFLNDVIDDSIGHMGYDAEKTDIYKFGPNSEMSKDIANSDAFKNFVSKNKDAIAKGITPDKPLSFAYTSGDLYYALANVRVIDSWVDSNGKTHLMLADIYDFNKNCAGNSAGAVLNRIGAAAQEDGELKAYGLLMEVVI